MKKILLILSFILTFSLTNVSASTCDSATMKKLKDKANNIKVSYEVETKTVENENYVIDGGNKTMEVPNIIIDLYNITDDVFVIISNDIDNTKKTIVYSDTDSGKYKLDTWDNFNALGTYTFDVYAKNEPCKPSKLKTITFAKPIENPLYLNSLCKENLDVPFCTQFITKPIGISRSDLKEKIEEYRKTSTNKVTSKKDDNTNNDDKNKVTEFVKDNKYYFIGAASLIIVIIVTVALIKKRRNQI